MRVIHPSGWLYPIARGDVLYYIDHGDTFWMYAHGAVREISKREYIEGVFGRYASVFEEYIGYAIAFGPDSFFLCAPQQSPTVTILEVAPDGTRRRCLELEGVIAAEDIEYQAPNHLWVVASTLDNVSCVDLTTERFVCDLAGYPIAGVPLCCPEAVAVYGEYLYVSECGNCRVCRVRLRGGGEVEGPGECLPIDGAVFAYQRAGGKEYVSTENALYEIENSVWQKGRP